MANLKSKTGKFFHRVVTVVIIVSCIGILFFKWLYLGSKNITSEPMFSWANISEVIYTVFIIALIVVPLVLIWRKISTKADDSSKNQR